MAHAATTRQTGARVPGIKEEVDKVEEKGGKSEEERKKKGEGDEKGERPRIISSLIPSNLGPYDETGIPKASPNTPKVSQNNYLPRRSARLHTCHLSDTCTTIRMSSIRWGVEDTSRDPGYMSLLSV